MMITRVAAASPMLRIDPNSGLVAGPSAHRMATGSSEIPMTVFGSAVTSALLAVQALLPGGGNVWLLWVLAAAVSGFTAVNQPTRSAVVPALVGTEGVPAANALAMTVRQVGVIAGPLLAGVLISLGGRFLAYAVAAIGFLGAVLLWR